LLLAYAWDLSSSSRTSGSFCCNRQRFDLSWKPAWAVQIQECKTTPSPSDIGEGKHQSPLFTNSVIERKELFHYCKPYISGKGFIAFTTEVQRSWFGELRSGCFGLLIIGTTSNSIGQVLTYIVHIVNTKLKQVVKPSFVIITTKLLTFAELSSVVLSLRKYYAALFWKCCNLLRLHWWSELLVHQQAVFFSISLSSPDFVSTAVMQVPRLPKLATVSLLSVDYFKITFTKKMKVWRASLLELMYAVQ
jgi:hypothetical protein